MPPLAWIAVASLVSAVIGFRSGVKTGEAMEGAAQGLGLLGALTASAALAAGVFVLARRP